MKNSIEYHNQIVKELNETIIKLTEQTDDEKKSDVASIRSDIEDLKNKLKSKQTKSLGFKKIRIEFRNEYELKLPKYGVKAFDRKLKGTMYFTVLGGTNDYMDIKTNSFPDTFRIRLTYKTLDTNTWQKGKGKLVYESGSENLVGDEESIEYRIKKKE